MHKVLQVQQDQEVRQDQQDRKGLQVMLVRQVREATKDISEHKVM